MFERIKNWLNHVHEWEEVDRMEVHSGKPLIYGYDDSDKDSWPLTGYIYIFRCKTCHMVKSKRVK